MNKTLLELEAERWQWSRETFPEATAMGSLCKLKSETQEIEQNIENNRKDPFEYADALMCLFDTAQRDGVEIGHILKAFALKLEINKGREWILNSDKSYSHVKPVNP